MESKATPLSQFLHKKKILLCTILGSLSLVGGLGFLFSHYSSLHTPTCDKASSCPVDTPVCGRNGFWYANPCLAKCAGVESTRHISVCSNSLSVTMNPSTQSTVLPPTADLLHKNAGYQFVGFLEHSDNITPSESSVEGQEGQSLRRLQNVRSEDTKPSQNKVVRYISEVSTLFNDKLQKTISLIGDYYYQDFSSLEDEMKGAWTIIEEDGSVYVKMDTDSSMDDAEDAIDNPSAFVNQSEAPTRTFGNLKGCGSPMNAPSLLNGNMRNINNSGYNVNLKTASFEVEEEEGDLNKGDLAEKRNLAVIGEDTRWRIVDSSASPHRQVGEMAPLGCSGTLVSPDHVITAGHCLWYRNSRMNGNGSYLASDWFIAGRLDRNNYSTKSKVTRKLIHRQYKAVNQNEFQWDFGLVKLAEPIGYELGWMGIEAASCGDSQLDLHVAGYPSDKTRHTMWMSKCTNTYVNCNRRSIVHYCDTAPGMSGSSMWVKNPFYSPQNVSEQEYVIKAVHVAGSSSANRATYIDRTVYDQLTSWIGVIPETCPMNYSQK